MIWFQPPFLWNISFQKRLDFHANICAFKSSTSKESSYKKTQECLEIVAQEFQFQGHHMIGPCAVAMASGHRGKRPGNISRDLKRKFERMIDWWCCYLFFSNSGKLLPEQWPKPSSSLWCFSPVFPLIVHWYRFGDCSATFGLGGLIFPTTRNIGRDTCYYIYIYIWSLQVPLHMVDVPVQKERGVWVKVGWFKYFPNKKKQILMLGIGLETKGVQLLINSWVHHCNMTLENTCILK